MIICLILFVGRFSRRRGRGGLLLSSSRVVFIRGSGFMGIGMVVVGRLF